MKASLPTTRIGNSSSSVLLCHFFYGALGFPGSTKISLYFYMLSLYLDEEEEEEEDNDDDDGDGDDDGNNRMDMEEDNEDNNNNDHVDSSKFSQKHTVLSARLFATYARIC